MDTVWQEIVEAVRADFSDLPNIEGKVQAFCQGASQGFRHRPVECFE